MRVLIVLALTSTAVMGAGCPADRGGKGAGKAHGTVETTRWLRTLKKGKTARERVKALRQLDRVYGLIRADRGAQQRQRLAQFRRLVSPALAEVFRQKVNGQYLAAEELLARLVAFEADGGEATAVYLQLLDAYAAGDARTYGDAARLASLAGAALDGLAGQARRGKAPAKGMQALTKLADALCKPGGAKRLDPRSDVRRALVKATKQYLETATHRPALAKVLTKLVLKGLEPKRVQDPEVTIAAIRQLGDVGDASPPVVAALVWSLLAKGRGRRFFSFATTALAKLPRGSDGKHPAVAPLLLMLQGDPWQRQLAKGKSAPAGLRAQYRSKRTMPTCPYPKYPYVCRIFWRAHTEEWDKTEPGVIQLNALIALRELGELAAVPTMLGELGTGTVQKRWLEQARKMIGSEGTRDKTIPGVLMQKMVIETYGKDANLRMEMLRSLGRMGAARDPKVRQELRRSLTWSGDPTMLMAAAEGISLARFDKTLYEALLEQITRHASFMSVTSKKRPVKMFFWGKAVRGSCPQGRVLERRFKGCLNDPPRMPGEREVKDANWNCLWKFRRYWLSEFYYAIGYHEAGDYKRLVQPFCWKTDRWWNHTRKRLQTQAKAGGATSAAALKLYACSEKATPAQIARGQTLRCGVWSHCTEKNDYLCLSGHWDVRLRFYGHAALLAMAPQVDALLRLSSPDLMAPHGLKANRLPRRGKSAFYDSDDRLYLSSVPWPAAVEKARLDKAREVLERRLCVARRRLWVVKECGADPGCYAAVARSTRKVPVEDCDKLGPPPKKPLKSRPTPTTKAAPDWTARQKALRMLALLGASSAPGVAPVKQAVRTAVEVYGAVSALPAEARRALREMALLVLDRLGSYAQQKDVSCTAKVLPEVARSPGPKADLALYRHKLRIARAHRDKPAIARYQRLLGPVAQQSAKAAAPRTLTEPCFRLLRTIARRETRHRVKGTLQINRDARNTLGRLVRRAGVRYGDL